MSKFTPKVYMVMEHNNRDHAYVLHENGQELVEYELEYTAQVASEGLDSEEGVIVNFKFMSFKEKRAYHNILEALRTFNDIYYSK